VNTELKHINNILDGVATILLYDQIGTLQQEDGSLSYGISGTQLAYEIQYLNEVEKVSRINVRINSIGGSVYEGYSIVSAILNSKAPVDTYVDGLAASIAGVIAMAGQKCYMMDYGTLMLHNPSGDASDDVLSYIKGTIVKIISNRCKRTPEEIGFMMDAETWLSAPDALKMNLCDEVISSAKEFKMDESTRRNLYNLVKVYNKLIIENTNPMTEQEKQELETKLAETIERVNSLESAKAELESKNATIEAELTEYKKKEDAAIEAEIETLVNSAIEAGKIKKESKESFVNLAKKDLKAVKDSLDAIAVTKAPRIVDALKGTATGKGVEDRATWSHRDWEKKDPKGLRNMYTSQPDEAKRLYEDTYLKK
jgi:ATP-dependent protease ClpP protease subunit